jgi:hypothetical protein
MSSLLPSDRARSGGNASPHSLKNIIILATLGLLVQNSYSQNTGVATPNYQTLYENDALNG